MISSCDRYSVLELSCGEIRPIRLHAQLLEKSRHVDIARRFHSIRGGQRMPIQVYKSVYTSSPRPDLLHIGPFYTTYQHEQTVQCITATLSATNDVGSVGHTYWAVHIAAGPPWNLHRAPLHHASLLWHCAGLHGNAQGSRLSKG